MEPKVGYAVGDSVGVASPTVGLLVGESVAFVGALVLPVGDGVGWGAFVGLLVGAPVVGLGVGGIVGAGGGTAPNMSSTSKKCEVSKLLRLGQASFILELGTPNQLAIPRNTASLFILVVEIKYLLA